jgi:hypothetical protein
LLGHRRYASSRNSKLINRFGSSTLLRERTAVIPRLPESTAVLCLP